MKFIFPIVSSLIFIIGMSFLARYLLKRANKSIWNWVLLKKIALWLPRATIIFQLIWMAGIVTGAGILYLIGSSGTTLLIFVIIIILLSIPPAWLLYRLAGSRGALAHDPARRKFLKSATAVFPVATLAIAGTGYAKSFKTVRVPVIEMPVRDLPTPLNGLRIAHLSDLHLGYYYEPDELSETLSTIAAYKPDIFLLTGDIADELPLLRPALDNIAKLETPFGGYACVGNHEYYRGIKKIIKIFAESPIPLLLEETASMEINGVPVVIGGVDDPVTHRPDMQHFLDRTVTKTFAGADPDAFKILLCHRPKGFNTARELGIHVTLAGHTHGGQFGFNGRSVFEVVPFEKYLWGLYHEQGKSLYTSSGMGHWFPFRLGCPAEAPVIILKRV